MTNRNHPARQLLDNAAMSGKTATNAQVAEAVEAIVAGSTVDVSATTQAGLRAQLRRASREVAEQKAAGNNGEARSIASELGAQIADVVGNWERPKTDPSESSTDPAALAALVPRR